VLQGAGGRSRNSIFLSGETGGSKTVERWGRLKDKRGEGSITSAGEKPLEQTQGGGGVGSKEISKNYQTTGRCSSVESRKEER